MKTSKTRLLKPEMLPKCLWDAQRGVLFLPRALARAYEQLIDKHGLRELAAARDPSSSPVGGITKEKTDEHFAQAFASSAARAQLALLDPKEEASEASNSYIRSIAGNHLSLTDAPCGAGAAGLTFLANIAELRAQGVLPRMPLDVILIGAEISPTARDYAKQMLDVISPHLENEAIYVLGQFSTWDVTDPLSNTDLIKQMTIAASSHSRRLLIVSNFNAVLVREQKRKAAQPQLNELFRHASGPKSLAVWIEPDMNTATAQGGLLHWVRKTIAEAWRSFAKESGSPDTTLPRSFADFELPLFQGRTCRVGLAVVPIDLTRNE